MQIPRIANFATANAMSSQQQNMKRPSFGIIKLDESKRPLQRYIDMFVEHDKDATGFVSSIFNRIFAQGGALDILTGAKVVKIKPFITRDKGHNPENLLNFRITSGSKKQGKQAVATISWDNLIHESSQANNEAEGILTDAVKRVID